MNYNENNILNLMSSILQGFGSETDYKTLDNFPDPARYKNVILLVIDGLGNDYIETRHRVKFLLGNKERVLSSVFPTTTASALTTLETGVPPLVHGITGWYMLLKELGCVSTVLPFHPRYTRKTFLDAGIDRENIFTEKRVNEKISQESYILYPKTIINGKVVKRNNTIIPYRSFNNIITVLNDLIRSNSKKKYIYVYWSEFDALCHMNGCSAREPAKHLDTIAGKIDKFMGNIQEPGTLLLITGDHGLIDTEPEKVIVLDHYPDLKNLLSLPLCGEPRTGYCYVHSEKREEFENYITRHLSHACECFRGSELIEKGLYGYGKSHPDIIHRIGDYVLQMKENYIIKDRLMTEKMNFYIGNHGGLSREEIYVPLIMLES